ncbi:MAG TPA: diguanylate cyclase [Solirubrobacteraceae bacterium]|nr:diguanylate cyclase [Solirubrobacteraceae bacterium]
MQDIDLDALPGAALALDGDGVIAAANALVVELFGCDPAGERLAPLLRCRALEDAPDVPLRDGRAEVIRRDGVPLLVDVSATAARAGRRLVFLRRLDAPRLIAESERLLQVAFETAPIGMAFFNTEGEYLRVNAALCHLLDRPAEELLGRRDQEFTHPDHRASDVAAAWRILEGEIDTWQTEKRFVRPDGSPVWVIANMSFLRDEDGRALAWLGQFQDITERKGLEERLRRLADEDPLTGLPNRRALEGAIGLALSMSDRHGLAGSVLMIDLDGFKEINDTHGHAVGDAALAATAQALGRRLRATDLLARVGGDEFAVLLRMTSGTAARTLADALAAEVRATTLEPGLPAIALAASIGVADFGTPPLPSVQELLARADAAMYAAKRDRR